MIVEESVWRELTDAGLALHTELSLDAVLQTLVERATVLTGARQAGVGILDRSGGDFERSVGRAELLQHTSERATLVAPILIRGVPYARLVVAEKRGGMFTSEDSDVLALLTGQAAVAIENARRYESAIRWLAQLEALSEIGNGLADELDLSRLLTGVTERLRELLNASSAYVFLPTVDGELEVRAAAGEAPPLVVGERLPRKSSKTGRVFDRARSERVDRAIEDIEVYQPMARRMNARALLLTPLLGEDGAAGVIVAVNKLGADDTFSEADLRLAETFAARVAVAVRLAARGGTGDRPTGDEEHLETAGAGLSTREIDGLRLVAYGMSDAEIAGKLVISLRTVHSHTRSIYRKLHVNSRSEATRWAVERRLV